jgi:hypothetical protein
MRVVQGLRFEAACPDRAEVLIDEGVTDDDQLAIAKQIEADLASVESEFQRRFSGSPVVFVFSTPERYAEGMRRVFGYGDAAARWVAENSVAFFEPRSRLIAVNWDAIRLRRPIAAIRHELTHYLTLDACAPRCDLVPAWLNEGQAHFAEAHIGAEWRLLRMRYEAASMALTETLLPLSALVTQLQWNAIGGWAGYYKYQQAARATELLRADIGGDAPIAAVYARLRRGDNIARAYAGLTGRSFEAFVRELPARMRGGLAPEPGIAFANDAPEGSGTSFVIFGFPPEATITLTTAGKWATQSQTIVVSPQGAHFGVMDGDLPPGRYTLNASAGGLSVSATVMKLDGRPVLWRAGQIP